MIHDTSTDVPADHVPEACNSTSKETEALPGIGTSLDCVLMNDDSPGNLYEIRVGSLKRNHLVKPVLSAAIPLSLNFAGVIVPNTPGCKTSTPGLAFSV